MWQITTDTQVAEGNTRWTCSRMTQHWCRLSGCPMTASGSDEMGNRPVRPTNWFGSSRAVG